MEVQVWVQAKSADIPSFVPPAASAASQRWLASSPAADANAAALALETSLKPNV